MVYQRTIRETVTVAGVGLHSGKAATVACAPAPPDSGIVFVRRDLRGAPRIPAGLTTVRDVQRGVTLGQEVSVRTVEHLLAAAAGLGLANLRVEVEGEELPALDGSAAPYYEVLEKAGVEEQQALWQPLKLGRPIWVEANSAWVLGLPADQFRATYIVPLTHAVLGTQVVTFDPQRQVFADQIAPARTWGFVEEHDALRAQGLALGASLANALGIGPEGYLIPPRFPDEPARHKVLDLMGDLALLGRPLHAHVIALGAGHALHIEFARRVVSAGHD